MRIGFVGLGIMGARMAAHLAAKGFTVAAWNRTRAKAEELVAQGATVADTPRAAATGADFVCTNVADEAALESVVFGEHGILGALGRGATLIDFSTVGPELSRRLERACEERGATFLESPVTGSKGGAASATLTIMCGGRPEVFEKAQPVLNAVGKRIIHVGPAGSAAQVKLIQNVMLAHMMEGLGEGAALAHKADIPLEKLLEVVQAAAIASPFWEFKGKALAARDFETHFSVDLMHKDLSLALETGRQLSVPMPGTAAIREVYQLARTQGLGAMDYAATAAVHDPSLVRKP